MIVSSSPTNSRRLCHTTTASTSTQLVPAVEGKSSSSSGAISMAFSVQFKKTLLPNTGSAWYDVAKEPAYLLSLLFLHREEHRRQAASRWILYVNQRSGRSHALNSTHEPVVHEVE
mmetsp:Transcript_655/g.729  ORF Transcript_655/g.729 Transcript_655/m.729 type:complete len:116 (+) Transcript_655:305-652(+)